MRMHYDFWLCVNWIWFGRGVLFRYVFGRIFDLNGVRLEALSPEIIFGALCSREIF